jgi:hypothetical protein
MSLTESNANRLWFEVGAIEERIWFRDVIDGTPCFDLGVFRWTRRLIVGAVYDRAPTFCPYSVRDGA